MYRKRKRMIATRSPRTDLQEYSNITQLIVKERPARDISASITRVPNGITAADHLCCLVQNLVHDGSRP